MNHFVRYAELNNFDLVSGSVQVVSRLEAMQCRHWANAFASEAKDRRYYELVEDTIHEEFDYRYFVVRNQTAEICAIQPFFILDLDLLVGTRPLVGRLTNFIRRFWPGFMRARTLMMGCAAGEGHLDGSDEAARLLSARLLASAIVKEARNLKARLVVLKEFSAKYRSALDCFVHKKFTRIPSLPNVILNIDYSSFEEYIIRVLSGSTRRKLRLKLKAAEKAPPIEMSVIDDITPLIDDVYPCRCTKVRGEPLCVCDMQAKALREKIVLRALFEGKIQRVEGSNASKLEPKVARRSILKFWKRSSS